MKGVVYVFLFVLLYGCGTSGKIKTGAKKVDNEAATPGDVRLKNEALKLLQSNDQVDFETFSAKAKVEYRDSAGKQPDATAHIRMKKDAYIWISITATFLNVEAARIWITPDSIVVVNKLYKYVMERPLNFVEQRFGLPMDFADIQKLVLGKIVLTDDQVDSVGVSENFLHIVSENPVIRNNIYFTLEHSLLTKQTLSVRGPSGLFEANILYENYSKNNDGYFSTSRDVTVPVLQLHLKTDIKQYEFNKELSVPFTKPDSYERL